VPYQFIVFLKDGINKSSLISFLLSKGIGVVDGLAIDSETKNLLQKDHSWLNHIALPLHQSITFKQIDYIVQSVKTYATAQQNSC
jgi:hypothetical protein